MLQDFFRLSGDIDINPDFFNPIKHPLQPGNTVIANSERDVMGEKKQNEGLSKVDCPFPCQFDHRNVCHLRSIYGQCAA